MVKPWLHLPSTASLLAVMVCTCAAPALAQRVSLADRVTLLEQRAADASAASSTANIELLNQLTQLRTELRELRGQIETLQQNTEQLKTVMRSQYLDLDERLQELERETVPSPEISDPIAAERVDSAGTASPPAADAAAHTPAAVLTPTDGHTAEHHDDAADPAPDPAQERAQYDTAFAALKAGRYLEAAHLFQRFLDTFPDGVYAANAGYWLGESYYVVEDYANAQAQFEAVIARWPEHDKAPGALLKIGLSQHGQRQLDAAEATLLEVERRYPGTDTAKIAADRLRAIQLSRLN